MFGISLLVLYICGFESVEDNQKNSFMNTIKKPVKKKESGRKPIDPLDKKKPVIVYISDNEMNRIGGEEVFKERCYALLK
jgi:hypothetical protein